MLPFSLQVTRYLIVTAARVECTCGVQDAYNAMFELSMAIRSTMSAMERDQATTAQDLFITLGNFASKARYGTL